MPNTNAALLCESCGYDIGGLPDDGNCPECGRPIASSSPASRTGSPWQQRPSPLSLVITNYQAIRETSDLYSRVRIDVRSGIGLAATNLLIAGAMVVLPWSGVLIGDPIRHANARGAGPRIVSVVWALPLQVLAIAVVLLLLTLVEWGGIQLAARTRGWRVTPAAAWQVCAHATVGWIITGLTSWVGLMVSLNVAANVSGPLGQILSWCIPVAWAFFGLIVFELLVWVGVRRCRFANPPSAARFLASPA
jgi:hypothetical protein